MTKKELAKEIVGHHLYQPIAEGVYSKNYYRYDEYEEVELQCKCHTKEELQDIYNSLYYCGRELSRHEINY